jgi:hypothetical protein
LFQQASANFGALKVLQDADSAAFALGGAAEALNVMGVIFVGAVGEVEARDIHTTAEELAHGGFGAAGGADGADDFGAARRGTVLLDRALLRLLRAWLQDSSTRIDM